MSIVRFRVFVLDVDKKAFLDLLNEDLELGRV